MTLEDAIMCKPVQVRTLDNRVLVVNFDEMVSSNSVHKISGEGMPRKQNNAEKGDLYVKFDIQFPKQLKNEYKQEIVDILRSYSAEA